MTAALTPREVLAAHVTAWDMPTLAADRPEVIEWLSARIKVGFDLASRVTLLVASPEGERVRWTETHDVRVAVLQWLAEEVAKG